MLQTLAKNRENFEFWDNVDQMDENISEDLFFQKQCNERRWFSLVCKGSAQNQCDIFAVIRRYFQNQSVAGSHWSQNCKKSEGLKSNAMSVAGSHWFAKGPAQKISLRRA